MITATAKIKGLDIADAMLRLNGKEALYTRLIGHFLKGAELTALQESIENGNLQSAVSAAHTLKGAAANLSAVEIQAAAATLERLLKESEAINDEHFSVLREIEGLFSEAKVLCAPYLEG